MNRRLALITGGTSGIGLAAAGKLSKSCDLALAYRDNHDRAEAAGKELAAGGGLVRTIACPLSTGPDAATLVDRVVSGFGRAPDILVNAAGRIRDGLFMTTGFDTHEQMVSEHLIVPMALCQRVIELMYKKKFGRIVNLSSISATFARQGQTSYAAAKSGIIGFTKTLAIEVAHRGITVNAVAPGLIDTPMTRPIVDLLERLPARELRKRIPAGFVGQPEDVGSLIAYLCSDEARYITGTVVTIDGGRSLGEAGS